MRNHDPIPLAKPTWDAAEEAALLRVLRSGVWSGPAGGPELVGFEAEMAGLTGSLGAVGVNSGTIGLQFALQALGIGAGCEVITVSYTFVGTLNAIHHAGARPVLVDIDPQTLNIDPDLIEAAITPRTRAVMLVHLFGRPAEIDAVQTICKQHGLALIEDACEAPGALYRGRPVGGFGDAGVFGFYPNKPIAAGEGGMIVSNNHDLLAACRRLRNQGNDPAELSAPCGARESTNTGPGPATMASHALSSPGYSARLSEWHAALGRVQLQRLPTDLERRRSMAERYRERLQSHPRIELPAPASSHTTIAWFTLPLRIRDIDQTHRDQMLDQLRAQSIACAPYFRPAHTLPFHRDQHLDAHLPVTDDIGQRCLGLPLYPSMTKAQVERVCTALIAAVGR
jgi:perosamine synthetase